MDEKILDIILDNLKEIKEESKAVAEKVTIIEKRISYFAGFFTAIGALASVLGQKLYGLLFGG